MGNDLMINVSPDTIGEDDLLDVSAFALQVRHRVVVGDGDDILADDGPCIQFSSDVVGCGTHEFDAALVGGPIGIGAGKSGQRGVVNVNDPIGKSSAKVIREYLHVAGQDNEVYVISLHQMILFCLHVGLGSRAYGKMVKGDVIALPDVGKFVMIADDEGYLDLHSPDS